MEKVKFILVGFFWSLVLPIHALAQHDSLIFTRDLNFMNETETQGFYNYSKDKDEFNLLKILLTPYQKKEGYLAEFAQKKIQESVIILAEKIKDKNEAKKIKIIHQYVHQNFFKVYKLNNSLTEVFEQGYYNCVSGSAIFAIILSKLNIPYQVVEAPSHVFLLAYPKTEKILLESTLPEKGSYQFSHSIIERYIADLYKSKLISKEEFEGNSSDTLFEKYYFASGAINLQELAGIQYNNYALYALDEQLNKESLQYIKKAYYLNPCTRSKHLLKYILFNSLNNTSYATTTDIDNLEILFRLYRMKDNDVTIDLIKNEYGRMLNTQLVENSAYQTCQEFHVRLIKVVDDSVLKDELNFIYAYELARLGLVNGNDYKSTTKYLATAYSIKPRNANLQAFILENFGNTVKKMNDVDLILETINSFEKQFNFLDSNFLFNTAKANVYLELAYQNFYLMNLQKGDEYLSDCDKLRQQKEVEPYVDYVEKAYAEAASYYFKKGNYTKAKNYLKSGLVLAPNSFGLKQRLKLIP